VESRPLNETLPPHRPLAESSRGRPPSSSVAPDGETKEVALDAFPKLGAYRIEAKVSEGGMGKVYRSFDPTLERRVAVKVLHDKFGRDPHYRERFLREARTIASLNHPRVAQIYGIETIDESLAIVMEYVDGSSLDMVVAERGKVPIGEVARWIRQAADGLRAAALQGIVHRDIKPSNLLLDRHGNVKIVDFGLAKDLGSCGTITDEGIVLGTPQYLSPEQGRGKSVDTRSDIYSLGATFFHLLTGRPPFDKHSQIAIIVAHVEESPPSPVELRPDVPRGFVDVIGRMMAVEPADRYPTYDELIVDLDAIIAGRPPIHADTTGGRFRDPSRRIAKPRRLPLLVVLSVACLALLAGVVVTGRKSPIERDLSRLEGWALPSDGETTTLSLDFARPPATVDEIWRSLWLPSPRPNAGEMPALEGDHLVWNDAEDPLTCSWVFDRIDSIAVYIDDQSGSFDFGISIEDPQSGNLRSLSAAIRPADTLANPIVAVLRNELVASSEGEPPLPRLMPPYALFVTFRNTADGFTELAMQVRGNGESRDSLYSTTLRLPGDEWNRGVLSFVCMRSTGEPFRLSVEKILVSGKVGDVRLSDTTWLR